MKNKYKQQLFVYSICVAVLFNMGMDLGAKKYKHAATHANPVQFLEFRNLFTEWIDLTFLQPTYEQLTQTSQVEKQQQQLDNKQEQEKQKQQGEQLPIELTKPKASTVNYEVTSYFLNVRANMNAASKILHVVKRGDILEVLNTTHNNWLKLKNGGYVHSNYAKLIDDNEDDNIIIVNKRTVQQIPKEPLLQVKPNEPTSTVKSESNLTEKQIAQIFEGTSLANHGLEQTIIETEQEYGINAYFTIAVMKLESGHGKSKIAKEKNNLFGLNAIDGDAFNKAFSFETKSDSVVKFGQLISENYVDKGLTSIEKVASKYCEANSKWSSLVMNIMKNDYKKLQ